MFTRERAAAAAGRRAERSWILGDSSRKDHSHVATPLISASEVRGGVRGPTGAGRSPSAVSVRRPPAPSPRSHQVTVQTEDRDLWIRRYHPAPDSDVRLLCLPHAGGSASFYFPVSQALSPRIDVLAVQYPGRQDRRLEPCVETIPELADRLLPLVLREADRPLALFGHSMGASLAFELAGLLERQAGVVPTMLFASGRRAPSRFRPEDDVHRRGDEALLTEIKRLAGTDTRILGDDEMLRMILPALRNDYRAAELYRPDRDPPGGLPHHGVGGHHRSQGPPGRRTRLAGPHDRPLHHAHVPGRPLLSGRRSPAGTPSAHRDPDDGTSRRPRQTLTRPRTVLRPGYRSPRASACANSS